MYKRLLKWGYIINDNGNAFENDIPRSQFSSHTGTIYLLCMTNQLNGVL